MNSLSVYDIWGRCLLSDTYESGTSIAKSLAMKRFVGLDLAAALTKFTSETPESAELMLMQEMTVWMPWVFRT
jgi:hypothetical protein